MTTNGRDLFTKVDKQVSVLKERIARQREVIKQAKLRGHSTAAAETIQRTLHESLRAFEQRRQQVFQRMEGKRETDGEARGGRRLGKIGVARPAARALTEDTQR
jgi:hypothetical protein